MNGKSLEYMQKRIKSGFCLNMPEEEFQDMHEVPFTQCLSDPQTNYIVIAGIKDSEEVIADLKYSPDAEFNYFITDSCVCDGTLLFMGELMTNILNKILQLKTCYKPVCDGISLQDIYDGKYAIHYEVGDFVVNSYIVDPPDKDKLWMRDRFTVMLPVKFTIEER